MIWGMNDADIVLPIRPAVELTPRGLRLRAPAKINLNLLVGARRADGFHSLDSLFATVTLYDELELTRRDDGRIGFSCLGADCGSDDKNLALRAARLLAGEALAGRVGGNPGVEIGLVKNIPPGKGLGGGSSDAAAVLAGLNQLWRLGLPRERLIELAARLGSDVPLFLGPPAGRMTGRGEVVQPVGIHPFVAVLILPDEATSTAEVYRAFDEVASERQAGHRQKSAGPNPAEPAGEADLAGRQLDAAMIHRRPPSQWRALLRNDLFAPACRVCPALGQLHGRLSAASDIPVCLTGSGSAMFIPCDDVAEAGRWKKGTDTFFKQRKRSQSPFSEGLARAVLVRSL